MHPRAVVHQQPPAPRRRRPRARAAAHPPGRSTRTSCPRVEHARSVRRTQPAPRGADPPVVHGRRRRRAARRAGADRSTGADAGELERGRGRDGQLLAGGGDVEPDADDRRGSTAPGAPRRARRGCPATLRPETSTSLGHFREASTPVAARTPSTTARPVSSGSHGQRATGTASGRTSSENVSAARGGVTHTRSSRPRPAVWCSVATTSPAGSPARARSATSAFVDGDAASTSTRQPVAAQASGSSGGRLVGGSGGVRHRH